MTSIQTQALDPTIRAAGAWVLAAPEGLLVLATHAGHFVHQDDSALLVDAIHRVVFPDIARQLREALAEGYELLQAGQMNDAVAVFELYAEAYPEAPNPYDSLGDAYRAAGLLEDARRRYERAVELAEAAVDERLSAYESNLERAEEEITSRRGLR